MTTTRINGADLASQLPDTRPLHRPPPSQVPAPTETLSKNLQMVHEARELERRRRSTFAKDMAKFKEKKRRSAPLPQRDQMEAEPLPAAPATDPRPARKTQQPDRLRPSWQEHMEQRRKEMLREAREESRKLDARMEAASLDSSASTQGVSFFEVSPFLRGINQILDKQRSCGCCEDPHFQAKDPPKKGQTIGAPIMFMCSNCNTEAAARTSTDLPRKKKANGKLPRGPPKNSLTTRAVAAFNASGLGCSGSQTFMTL